MTEAVEILGQKGLTDVLLGLFALVSAIGVPVIAMVSSRKHKALSKEIHGDGNGKKGVIALLTEARAEHMQCQKELAAMHAEDRLMRTEMAAMKAQIEVLTRLLARDRPQVGG